ncbi:MAG: T9SS type A sorting domain-containing protein, partial [Bacteroidales bacterium]|nr:T9SS type A sorting domain-containing protein [Bacteroidales bacterium]
DSQTPPPFYREEDKLPNMKFMFQGTGSREFYNLHVNKSAVENELTTLANLLIGNNLEVMSGALTASYNVDVDGNVIVGSDAKSTSEITIETDKVLTINGDLTLKNTGKILLADTDDPLTNPGFLIPKQQVTVEGNGHCCVQRYYHGNQWHMISSPVSDAVSDVFTGNVLQYHTEEDNEWHDIVPIDHPLTPVQGFSLWGFSDDYLLAEYNGTPNAGNQTFTFSNSGTEGTGWNLIGNPYPANLNWDEVTIPDNLDAAIYLWDPGLNDYRYYLTGGPSNTASQYVALAQGLFVHCNNVAGGMLTLTPDAITAEPTSFYKNTENQQMNTLVYEVQGFPTTASAVRFREDATKNFDPNLDVYRIDPGSNIPLIYTIANANNLSVNSLPVESNYVEVNMGFRSSEDTVITLNFSGQESFDEGLPLFLYDQKEDLMTNLRDTYYYTFSTHANDSPNRFKLIFGKASGVIEDLYNPIHLEVNGRRVHVVCNDKDYYHLFVSNMAGQIVHQENVYGGNTSFDLLSSGVYLFTIYGGEKQHTKKIAVY